MRNPGHLLGVIGDPVEHSFSPYIFQKLAELNKKNMVYKKMLIQPRELKDKLEFLQKIGALGLNVTTPHKEKVISYLENQAPEVKILKACNVIHYKNKKINGYNTDILGIYDTFRLARVNLYKTDHLVFGAGGAARALCYVLGKEKARKVFIKNRTLSKAKKLSREFSKYFPKTIFQAVPWNHSIEDNLSSVSNATVLGLKKTNKAKTSFHLDKIQGTPFAFDLIYHKEKTMFLKEAIKLEFKGTNGLNMLVEQALAAYEIWLGPMAKKRIVKEKLMKYLKEQF